MPVADWATISSLATAGGTLVLAIATFSSVRSSNRSARTAERALQVGLRPVLMPSRLQDPPQKVMWAERRWTTVEGGRATVEEADGNIYFVVSIRNVGAGIAVIQAWHADVLPLPPRDASGALPPMDRSHPDIQSFRPQMRDIYVASGDTSFWQGAIRGTDDPDYRAVYDAVAARELLTIYLLYTDNEGGQRTMSRFQLAPASDDKWLVSVVLHWNLDRVDPR